jgi:hypothetical protein
MEDTFNYPNDKREYSQEYSIELDSPPMSTRPGDLLSSVLKGTELTCGDFVNTGRLFGNWTFNVIKEKEEIYKKNVEHFKNQITKLYNSGAIRYGSW